MRHSVEQIPSRPLIETCSIWRALEVIGDKPILLLLETMWLGANRFSQIIDRTGLQKALLSNRLKRLIASEIIVKQRAPETSSAWEYVLTQKGLGLFSTVMMLYTWEQKWGYHDKRHSYSLKHLDCDHHFIPQTQCGSCEEHFTLKDVSWEKNMQGHQMTSSYTPRRNQSVLKSNKPSLLSGAVEILGDRWSALIMRAVFTGNQRFDDIIEDIKSGPNILSMRLKSLMDSGVLKPELYQSQPERFKYKLTAKGYDYYNVIMMLMLWGDEHYGLGDTPPMALTHVKCAMDLNPVIICDHCARAVNRHTVRVIDKPKPS